MENNEEWVFMWSSALTMPNYWGTPKLLKERQELFTKASIFQYFDGKLMTAYMVKSDLKKFKKESKKYLDREFFKKYRENYKKETKNWWNWIRLIEKKDYSNVSDKELAEDYKAFMRYMVDAIYYFGSTRTEFTYSAEEKLKEIISRYFGDWQETFDKITTPIELDDIQREKLDWLNLSNNVTDKMLLEHASKYPWLLSYPLDDKKTIEHFKERMNHESGNFESENKELVERKRHLKEEQEEIFKRFEEDREEIEFLSNFMKIQAVERMNIKSYWAGCYYLARNFLWKIAERLDISLDDSLMFLTSDEIIDFLKNKNANVKDLIEKRRKSFAIFYEHGKDAQLLNHEEADSLFRKLIKTVKDDEVIKGQTASLGNYTGKVRKVPAGDLGMLKNSIKDFKQGEVLVTSMTQPNMMIIAKKAGAIIADEGGITSHAAIISRELKIPCIVGCLHSMQVLNDGDLIEVDANKGVVKILERFKH